MESGNILDIRKTVENQRRRSTFNDFWNGNQSKENAEEYNKRSRELSDSSRKDTIIQNCDDKESDDGFIHTVASNSRLDSISNFHIATNSISKAQIFHDTDSDEDKQITFNMPTQENEVEEDYKKTIITPNPKSRFCSITDIRTLSITRTTVNSQSILIQKGFMSKRSPNMIQCWQKRFFILTNNRLQYYKTEQDFQNKKPPKGILNFQQVCIETEFKDIQFLIFLRIRGVQRIFQFKCPNQDDYDQWKEKIQNVIDQSQGKINKFDISQYKTEVNQKEKFWRHLRIKEKEFLEKADTGDIILCSNVKKDNQIRYEAAFLLFKMEDTIDLTQKGLFVLSPSQTNLDIIMGTWDQFKDYHMENYTDICLRQIKIDRDEDFLHQSDDFMNELRDKPFYGDGKSEPKRSYSNLELILKYLRCLNLLKQQTKDERKMPVNCLSQTNSFQLSLSGKDCLGEEQYLMLHKQSQILNTINDQDKIQSMFDDIENKTQKNSVSDIELEQYKNIGQENLYQEIPDRETVITKKDKEDFILDVTKQ